MKSIKLQILLGFSTCALLLTGVQVWGSSTNTNAATPMPVIQEPQTAPPALVEPAPDASKSTTFTGTIVKDGEQYVLRDSAGTVYKLDDSSRAQAFEGKTVKVTGRLDADSKIIHVETVQALTPEAPKN
jgi:uncharacterized protein YdeI (BOF family)